MRILALETSCDETAVAVVEDGRRTLANIILTQNELHAQYGGVVPEAAARQHLGAINRCLDQALQQAGLSLENVDCFAATLGPGLIGSLLIGANAAKALSLVSGKPFRGVHHLYGHVCANYLDSDLKPPFLCLLVSGGHTQLIHVSDYDRMEILGETLDDAVGEAYDKTGRLLGAGFPGGPALDRLAQHGNSKAFNLPTARTQGPYDFSFSGLKTAMRRAYERACAEPAPSPTLQEDLAASFQHTVVETLFRKTLACAEARNLTTIAIAGGVSANQGLRQRFQAFASNHPDYRVCVPKMAYCTDNAAMIASSAFLIR